MAKQIKVALVIGHSVKSPGAENKQTQITEFGFNNVLANIIKAEFNHDNRINIEIIYRDIYKNLPYLINSKNPDLIFCLHCNAYNTKVNGSEVLYYHTSKVSRNIALITQQNFINFLDSKNRGVKAATKKTRGSLVLRKTKAYCILTEPFFIDNIEELEMVYKNFDKLIKSYVKSINESINYLSSL